MEGSIRVTWRPEQVKRRKPAADDDTNLPNNG
jgi:hypothetical protein